VAAGTPALGDAAVGADSVDPDDPDPPDPFAAALSVLVALSLAAGFDSVPLAVLVSVLASDLLSSTALLPL